MIVIVAHAYIEEKVSRMRGGAQSINPCILSVLLVFFTMP